jgi:hypothetical protein
MRVVKSYWGHSHDHYVTHWPAWDVARVSEEHAAP